MIKVILFDIDNTLLSFDKFVIETMKRGFLKFGIGTYEDNMFPIFNKINSALWQEIEKGTLTLSELKKKRWNLIFSELGINANGEEFEKYFRQCLLESAIPIEGSNEVLEYLFGKYILCVASNGPFNQQIKRLKLCGMFQYFFDLFISEEIGFSKPDKEFFKALSERLNYKLKQEIKPCEILIVGDSLSSDMTLGLNFGMKTCFFNPNKKIIDKNLKLDYEISSLIELKQIL